MTEACRTCKGSGKCQPCNGEGTISTSVGLVVFPDNPRTVCTYCGEIGEESGDGNCRNCNGTGKVAAR